MTDLAAALLKDVPRYDVFGYDWTVEAGHDGDYVSYAEVLAALSRALDPALTERAGEVLEGVTPYDGDPCGCAYCADNPATLWRNGDALCGECQDRQEAALVPALLAQNAALRAERDVSNELGRAFEQDAGQQRARAEAAEAQIAALTARGDGLTGALHNCVGMLDCLVAESGRSIEWGQEDPFRMGEWFEPEDLAQIKQARAALSATTEEGK